MAINSADGRSFAPFCHRFVSANDWLGKPIYATQAVTDPTNRQFADRAVVASKNKGPNHD